MSLTDNRDIAVLVFVILSGCTQPIKETTHELGNCLNLLRTDIPDVVDPLVDLPLGNFDHYSFSISVKINFNISNILFSRKIYLNLCVEVLSPIFQNTKRNQELNIPHLFCF